LFIKPDGTKLYITGYNGDSVDEYNLSTAWDISSASASQVFYVGSQDTIPTDVFFKSDGTKMYICGYNDQDINEYSLSTAWDISTASYSQNFSISSQDTLVTGVFFKPDGTKMYITGDTNNNVFQYGLTTAWDISTASYESKSVASQGTAPQQLSFNGDGTKLFILDSSGTDSVYQYSCSTAYDVSTATYDSVSFAVNSQDTTPNGLFFKDDGAKMYVLGDVNNTIYQYSTGSTVTTGSFDLSTGNYFTDTPSADVEYTFSNAGDVQSFQLEVTGAQVVNGFDMSVAAYDSKSFSVASQDTYPTGIQLNDDGTKMFIVGDTGDDINEYTLSTAYDISTATYSQNFSVSSQTSSPQDIFFKPDGTKMYIVSAINPDSIYQYGLTTGFDLSTASYDSKSLVVGGGVDANALVFKPDGTEVYVIQAGGDRIDQWSLSTAWDVSTASYTSSSSSIASQETVPRGLAINSDGTKVFIVGIVSDTVYQYSMSTAYDISTLSYDSVSFSVSSQDSLPGGLTFKPDGTKLYLVGAGNDTVYQYTTGSSTAITVTWDADIAWPSGTAPDSPAAGEKDIYTFTTDDGGTTYIGVQSGDAFS
jgi:sugar lactone lactonase YvrE